jgi:hypothetical protein
MAFIEALSLETWVVNVFAGSQEVFIALAMFFIFGMAAYFRMNILTMMFMFVVFILMFNAWLPSSFLIIFAIIGGALVGKGISKWLNR